MTRYSQYIKIISIISDILLLNLCYIILFYYKFGEFHDPFLAMLFYINFAWFFLTGILKPYNISRTYSYFKILKSSYTLIIAHILLVFAYYVFQQDRRYSRELLLLMYSSLAISNFIFKTGFYIALTQARKKGYNYRNIVIFSNNTTDLELHNHFNSRPEYGYRIKRITSIESIKQKNAFEELKTFCLENQVHEIFYSMSAIEYKVLAELMNFAEDNLIKVRLIADFEGVAFKKIELEKYGDITVLKVLTTPLDQWDNQLLKRVFDFIFSLLIVVTLLSWLLPLLAILIKLDSKGSVFFKQQRTGRDNKTFWCYKLRTMYQNDKSDILQATKNDSRITRIGNFLRNTSLDELPQFFNVLVGNMSVVGPRPHMLKHTKDFSEELEKFMARHQIKPGITGLAQSMGYRGETVEFEQKKNRVKLDLFYIRNWS
ncbi:MAG: exopolysaccharide biosynthesis polyprenyl glycosylphosphotransferase, partial [Bacteroidia bacterium]|nr:exopolysaccharide biosynthesis polyprenyl glycosylphosphotransferase [Bacteroidia bacterium]